MAKTRQVLDLQDNGLHYSVIYCEGQTNPYRLYKRWYAGPGGEHRKLIEKYADLRSCLYLLAQLTR